MSALRSRRGKRSAWSASRGAARRSLPSRLCGCSDVPDVSSAARFVFQGGDLLSLDEAGMRRVRGAGIGFIFQEPMAALSPVFSVGDQIAEAIVVHGQAGWPEARRRAVGLLEAVRVPDAASRASDYPHQLSGGLRQRAMIAVALACRPPLIIADEPTTALDVTIQAEILELLRDLRIATGWPSCSSRTTSASSPRRPTPWPSCMPAASSNTGSLLVC